MRPQDENRERQIAYYSLHFKGLTSPFLFPVFLFYTIFLKFRTKNKPPNISKYLRLNFIYTPQTCFPIVFIPLPSFLSLTLVTPNPYQFRSQSHAIDSISGSSEGKNLSLSKNGWEEKSWIRRFFYSHAPFLRQDTPQKGKIDGQGHKRQQQASWRGTERKNCSQTVRGTTHLKRSKYFNEILL